MREKKRWNEKQKSRRYDQEVMDEEIWNYQQRQHKITTAQKNRVTRIRRKKKNELA